MIVPLAQFRIAAKAANRPLIGLDVGTRKTGIAFSDAAQMIAWPLETIQCDLSDADLFVSKLKEALAKQKLFEIAGWVFGVPLAQQPTVHERRIRRAVEHLIKVDPATFKNVCLMDERYSTAAAIKMNLNRKNNNVDAAAAYEILCRYMDSR